MSDKYDGGPAFPVNGPNGDHPGMSLRDWFAGMCMMGASSRIDQEIDRRGAEIISKESYMMADSMLKAREQ